MRILEDLKRFRLKCICLLLDRHIFLSYFKWKFIGSKLENFQFNLHFIRYGRVLQINLFLSGNQTLSIKSQTFTS